MNTMNKLDAVFVRMIIILSLRLLRSANKPDRIVSQEYLALSLRGSRVCILQGLSQLEAGLNIDSIAFMEGLQIPVGMLLEGQYSVISHSRLRTVPIGIWRGRRVILGCDGIHHEFLVGFGLANFGVFRESTNEHKFS